ncbi:MAG: PEGA domain-containing protein [Polyangiaceae bacterium]
MPRPTSSLSLRTQLISGAVCAVLATSLLQPAFAAPTTTTLAAPKAKPLTDAQKKEKAGELFKAANDKYKANDFTGALEGFRAANDVLPGLKPQFLIADCLDKLGKGAEAIAEYQKFLSMNPPEKMADMKKSAEDRIAALQNGTLKVASTPAGATIKVNGAEQAAKTPTTLNLKPGKYEIELSSNGFATSTRSVELAAGATVEINSELAAMAPPVASSAPAPLASAPPPAASSAAPLAPEAPKPEGPRSPVPAYVTLGLGGASLVVGTIFGLGALSARSDFNKTPTTSLADKAERNALIADMAFGIAVTLGVTGTVLLVTSGGSSEPAKAAVKKAPSYGFAPMIGPNAQGASGFFTF